MVVEVSVVVESSEGGAEGGAGGRDLCSFLYSAGSNRVYRLQNLH